VRGSGKGCYLGERGGKGSPIAAALCHLEERKNLWAVGKKKGLASVVLRKVDEKTSACRLEKWGGGGIAYVRSLH